MKNTFVIVGRFSYSHEAHVFKTKLESAGIPVFVDFDNTGGGNPFSTINQGVTVKILEKYLALVNDILEEVQREKDKSLTHLNSKNITHKGKTFMPNKGYCPECDSEYIYLSKLGLLKSIVSMLLISSFLPASFRSNNLCSECNHEWKD